MASRKEPASNKSTAAVAKKQRKIQAQVDGTDARRKPKADSTAAVQTGKRKQPETPLPAQHLQKPGSEAALRPRPRFMAPDYLGSQKLAGMVALITGGDSGIGRSVAVLYAREGADVAIVYLNEHDDAHETQRCIEAEGRRCILLPGDVKDASFCREAVQATVDAFGKLDILVNNAAFQEHAATLEEITDEHFDETLRTNLYGYFYMARAALPFLGVGGCIINTGSETGLFGSKELLDYSTTKGGIHAFTKALASNVVERGIRVNAVAPGPVWTPLNPADRAGSDVKKFGKKTAMKRPAQPEEISPAYVFLASPVTASYITGVVLPIMGGTPGG
ncbi:MAG: SDR family oxidoreductase [Pseudomonadota bacterium]|nr:SDR family oxidoreductase [Pseudomonadota bacterium]